MTVKKIQNELVVRVNRFFASLGAVHTDRPGFDWGVAMNLKRFDDTVKAMDGMNPVTGELKKYNDSVKGFRKDFAMTDELGQTVYEVVNGEKLPRIGDMEGFQEAVDEYRQSNPHQCELLDQHNQRFEDIFKQFAEIEVHEIESKDLPTKVFISDQSGATVERPFRISINQQAMLIEAGVLVE